ncbi:MAG: hypothetical protein GDA43_19220 [Hormoscilla sp. SP5CHS1]|nr:hypothetical protein [Hormoscilla sp. SP12CHS1]MBC6455070.1 hypothetical protein [Hormoscilla sp. SP5CHS1]
MCEKFTLAFIITILLQLFVVGNPNSVKLPEDAPLNRQLIGSLWFTINNIRGS